MAQQTTTKFNNAQAEAKATQMTIPQLRKARIELNKMMREQGITKNRTGKGKKK